MADPLQALQTIPSAQRYFESSFDRAGQSAGQSWGMSTFEVCNSGKRQLQFVAKIRCAGESHRPSECTMWLFDSGRARIMPSPLKSVPAMWTSVAVGLGADEHERPHPRVGQLQDVSAVSERLQAQKETLPGMACVCLPRCTWRCCERPRSQCKTPKLRLCDLGGPQGGFLSA